MTFTDYSEKDTFVSVSEPCISVTPKMVKNVIMNLDLSKTYGADYIPVVVLKNCKPEPSYVLAELFNNCLKDSCFPDCWKVSLVDPVFH